jgi:HTH-type transcriptional regulator/antitoxin HigA
MTQIAIEQQIADIQKATENATKSQAAALKFLMKAHHLSQSDLPEIASQGVLSEILRGKRTLNLRQTKLLAKRFGVAPATFIND